MKHYKTFKEWNALKVEEINAEMKDRRMRLSKNGKRFTKAEKIDQLIKYDCESEDIEKELEECLDDLPHTPPIVKEIKQKYLVDRQKNLSQDVIDKGYAERCKQGTVIAFIHSFKAKSGKHIEKIRQATIKSVNVDNKTVRAETYLGTILTIPFNEILWFNLKSFGYPRDIWECMKSQKKEHEKRVNIAIKNRSNKSYGHNTKHRGNKAEYRKIVHHGTTEKGNRQSIQRGKKESTKQNKQFYVRESEQGRKQFSDHYGQKQTVQRKTDRCKSYKGTNKENNLGRGQTKKETKQAGRICKKTGNQYQIYNQRYRRLKEVPKEMRCKS